MVCLSYFWLIKKAEERVKDALSMFTIVIVVKTSSMLDYASNERDFRMWFSIHKPLFIFIAFVIIFVVENKLNR
jgi:hypothetical protein